MWTLYVIIIVGMAALVTGIVIGFRYGLRSQHADRQSFNGYQLVETDSANAVGGKEGEQLESYDSISLDEDSMSFTEGEIITNVTHEIRTPLNAITGLIDILQLTELTPKQRDYLYTIRTAVQSLLLLSNSLIVFSGIRSGVLHIEKSRFEIIDVLESVFRKLMPEIGEKDIEFTVRSTADVPKALVGDAIQLEQVLINLGQNAIKFTEKGFVAISISVISREHENVILGFSVKDTGIGIEPDQVVKLFKPFIQGDGSSTRKYGGIGLGLAVSHKLVQMMGGELKYRKTSLNGAEFYFNLSFSMNFEFIAPKYTADESTKELNHQDGLSVERIKDAKILLIEDDSMSQDIQIDILKGLGVEHIEVRSSGILGVEAVKNGNHDLVLMDIEMTPVNGYEATRAIRAWEKEQRKGSHIPIIALTAHQSLSDINQCLEAGMDGYIAKPIEPSKVLKTISRLLPDAIADNNWEPHSAGVLLLKKPGMPTGINMKEAIARFGGNREAFYRHLLDFARQHNNIVPQFMAELSNGNDKFVLDQLHIIQGIAGNLSATRIADKARALKDAITDGQKSLQQSLISEFEGALKDLIDSVLIWDYAFQPNGISSANVQHNLQSVSIKDMQSKLDELSKMLEENNMNAEDMLISLYPLFESRGLSEEFRQLETRVTLLDFKSARNILARLQHRLGDK